MVRSDNSAFTEKDYRTSAFTEQDYRTSALTEQGRRGTISGSSGRRGSMAHLADGRRRDGGQRRGEAAGEESS